MAKKRRRKLKRKLPLVIFCILLAALFASGYALASKLLLPNPAQEVGAAGAGKDDEDIPDIEGRLNFLLMGMDARPGETKARTDTMIFVSIDKETGRIAMMSIPRDTRVEIPGHGVDKINAANVYGGPELASKTVSKLLNVPIDYYVLTNFDGFKDIVDAVGGVKIDVEQDMRYKDPADGTLIDLKKGRQRLDGEKALQYVRYRGYVRGDIDRTVHQQKFLKALAKEVLQPSTVTKLHKLVPSINRAVDTNLGLVQMASLAKAARNLSSAEIITQTLPGQFMTIDGISYWHVEPEVAQKAVASIFEGKTMDVVQGGTIVKNTKKPEKEAVEEPAAEEREDNTAAGEQQQDTGPEQQDTGSGSPAAGEPDESKAGADAAAGQQESSNQQDNNTGSSGDAAPWLPQDSEDGQQPVPTNSGQQDEAGKDVAENAAVPANTGI
ncbi:LCP family protein required for cell wall assembly [Desulfohalotomaculum tongense]|uniref:LCP family protein n=1 Tax=Desulforadius tongensis TaxID=1216062 RepID=UPI001957F301|nr:LCP family protein [Desulforadius tongensis]MBM7853701.1 LCP family protein required for cell wall assembly [Desulforadius tongensis]